jgi:hypothetical protein
MSDHILKHFDVELRTLKDKLLLMAGVVEVVGITGSSGAGVVPTATTHHPTRWLARRSSCRCSTSGRWRRRRRRC